MRTFAVSLLVVLALVAAVFGFVGAASAATEYINAPAVAFPPGGNTSYLASFGAIESSGADVVRAPVYFKMQGLNICRLTLYAHDFDSSDVTARLVRKLIAPDGSSFGRAPQTLASVSSAGAEDVLRAFSTTAITGAAIKTGYFYWVELDFAGGPIQVTGVRVFTATTCP
jgi:hypothetical protein